MRVPDDQSLDDEPDLPDVHLRVVNLTRARRTVQLGGRAFDEERLIRDLRAKVQGPTRYLVRQLVEDSESHGSIGLEVLVKAFGPELHAFIGRLVGGDSDGVADVFADWLRAVLARAKTYDPSRSAFRTWLYEQAKYVAVDWRRRQARVAQPIDLAITDENEASVTGEEAHPQVLTTAERRALGRAVRRLRPAQRELIWWRYVEGWTPTEIARQKLDGAVPETHVKVYVARALTRLARLYEEEVRSG